MTLRTIESALCTAGIPKEDAAFEARLLAAHCTGISPARLLTMRDGELSSPSLEDAVARRCKREPLQYILGEWEFMGLTFAVSPACLIPRADTETLVEAALPHIPKNARVADLCTGSGAIGIALAHFRPDILVTAVELFPETAQMAEKNSRRLGVSERFTVLQGDVTKKIFQGGTSFDMIVSNPPYIALNEMEGLEPELAFEPRAALTDEGDGLSVIRGVLRTAAETLTPNGLLLMEIGASQGESVLSLAADFGFSGKILPDTAGRDRVLFAHRYSDKSEANP